MSSLERARSPLLASTPMSELGSSGHNKTGRGKYPSHRELKSRVMQSPVPEGAIKPILRLWNHEEDYCDQSPRVLDEVETLLNFETMPWPNQDERALLLGIKVDWIFSRLLYQHGYPQISYSTSDHKHRLKASPRPGTIPKELPDWLDTPYLCLLPPQDLSIRYEGCANPTIRAGDVIYDSTKRQVGSFSCIMESKKPGTDELIYVCLVPGHIIADGEDTMLIKGRKTSLWIHLRLHPSQRRINGRPSSLLNNSPSFRDDCAFLMLDPSDISCLELYIPNLNPHHFSSQDLKFSDVVDLLSLSRYKTLRRALKLNGCIVYKFGPATQLTVGRLVDLTVTLPDGWFRGSEDHNQDFEHDEWIGVVQWIADPFSAPGDSGSLVYTLDDGVFIPLGIHIGAPESIARHSVFVSLETFCFVAADLGMELTFPSI